jgi:hypothetical protein
MNEPALRLVNGDGTDNTIAQLEQLARRLGCDTGRWTIELTFVDGKLRDHRLHYGPAGNDALGRRLQDKAPSERPS